MKRFVAFRLLFVAVFTAPLCIACSGEQLAGGDKIFISAFVYTLDPDMPQAEAVAIKGNTIVYVGDNDGAIALAGKGYTSEK